MTEMIRLRIHETKFNGFSKIPYLEIKNGTFPDYVTNVYSPLSADIGVSFECDIDIQRYQKIFHKDSFPPSSDKVTVECSQPYLVQNRRHKKWRTNKKWAKRYGYKIKFKTVRITDVTFKSSGESVEFAGMYDSCISNLRW